jgi:hypothetical protein
VTAGVENAVHTTSIIDGGICHSVHIIKSARLYKLRIFMVDDGLVLQKILIRTAPLERANTNRLSANISVDPDTREKITGTRTVDILSVSIPRIFIGSQQSIDASYDSYFGPLETYFIEKIVNLFCVNR